MNHVALIQINSSVRGRFVHGLGYVVVHGVAVLVKCRFCGVVTFCAYVFVGTVAKPGHWYNLMKSIACLVLEYSKHKHGQLREFGDDCARKL